MRPFFEVVEADGGLFIGRGATPRTVTTTGGSPRGSCRASPGPPSRRSSGARPLLGPDRRRELLGVHLRLPPCRALTTTNAQAMKDGHGVHNEYVPGTFRPLQNKDNDYLMDRDAQRAARPSPGSRGSRCRMPRCRRAWGRSSTAPRSGSSRPTRGIIKARQAAGEGLPSAPRRGGHAAGVDPSTTGSVPRRRAAQGAAIHRGQPPRR
jgi:phthalate 4,5-dioxygenase